MEEKEHEAVSHFKRIQCGEKYQEGTPRRDYKDRLFRMLFSEKDSLLNLYNAVNGTSYRNPEELEIVTLENAVYMNMKNDLAFVINFYLNLYEHQSTFSENMPLRNLFYVSREIQAKVEIEKLYLKRQVKIPTPRFLVFYNGTEERPEREILKLSDAFMQSVEEPELELIVTILNINRGKNQELLEQCSLLKEYMLYVEKIRKYAGKLSLEESVEKAVEECIREDILKDFLIKNRKEAIAVSIYEYNEERVLKYIREEEFQRGIDLGRQEGIDLGRQEGMNLGRQEGIRGTVKVLQEFGHKKAEIKKIIAEQYGLSAEKAEDYF